MKYLLIAPSAQNWIRPKVITGFSLLQNWMWVSLQNTTWEQKTLRFLGNVCFKSKIQLSACRSVSSHLWLLTPYHKFENTRDKSQTLLCIFKVGTLWPPSIIRGYDGKLGTVIQSYMICMILLPQGKLGASNMEDEIVLQY